MAALFLARENMMRRRRVFRERVDSLDHLTDSQVIERYRLSRQAIFYLVDLLHEDIAPVSERSHAIGTMSKVLVALRFFAKGDFYSETGDLHGISRSSVSRHVHAVTSALNRRLDNIVFPREDDGLIATKMKFYEIASLPNVIGAVDGTLIPILSPPGDEEAVYVCRKGFHALNVQAIVNADLRFTDVVARWPGSQHDSTIFENSAIKEFLQNGEKGWLVGDSGYGLKNYLITPKLNPSTNPEIRFNHAHSRTRMVVERAFGVLKMRFRCLHRSGGVLPFSPEKCAQVICACMRLHNLCLDLGLPLPEANLPVEEDGVIRAHFENQQNQPGNALRQQLIDLFRH